jgi:SAM-dependent methyltransferase
LAPESDRSKWEARYAASDYEPEARPTPFLVEATDGLSPGTALVLAAGAGRNAVHLARHGWRVTAVDIAPTGLDWCRRLATEAGVEVETMEADLVDPAGAAAAWTPGNERWDLVTMVSYLQPALFGAIRRSLRPGGRFLLHTFGRRQPEMGWGPSNPAFFADVAQLRDAFDGFDLERFDEGAFERPDGRREYVVRLLARRPD